MLFYSIFNICIILCYIGELYDIGFGQKLYMGCVGQGKPTVILDAPTGMSSDAWTLVVPKLSKITKVCVYDRAGLGFSDRLFINRSNENDIAKNRGAPSTTERMTDDFHRLFTGSSSQPKPFILVGSELGAVNARFYTQLFEDQIAGLVLINPLIEEMFIGEGYPWTGLWLRNHISGIQVLQFSAAIGINRLAFIFGLMKTQVDHKVVGDVVTARQKYLMCKPGHLSSAVDEYFFANESLSQLRTLSKLKRFNPSNVGTSILISKSYSKRANDAINKVSEIRL
jgi:pimeloyl-ACP methyl ester carboxylesterase